MSFQPMDSGVGRLSDKLRRLLDQQLAETPAVTQRALVAMREAIPEYRLIEDAATRLDVQESVEHNVRLWFTALLTGEPPSPADLEPITAFGRRRVHQGVSLQSLLQAFRTGSRVLWDVLLEQADGDAEIHHELLFKVSPYILFHFDILGQTIGQAHSVEQQQRARWRERLRHELCSVIFSHPDDLDTFRDHCLSLGLDAGAPHLVLALRLTEASSPLAPIDSGSEKILGVAARTLGLEREGFLRTHRHGHLLIWVPLPAGEPAIEVERKLAVLAESMLKNSQGVSSIGVGMPDSGPRGWRRSADQALRALDIGLRVEPDHSVQRYLDVALDDALGHSENVVRYYESLIERLAREAHLVKTLQTFFEHRQHRKAVAGALNIHPNTLSYRLERIETILGARLDDVAWQARLHAALRLRHLNSNQDPG